ncbi:MAG: prolipoprotein diacylglyceryl transferase [Anaerolineales bacterium]|jgi:phosphatidylglycerol:prolipoprotein diacylglycerol transferase|nr:prolipoprotein diacylglyceryl transferase [Anaerolineales bacterium]
MGFQIGPFFIRYYGIILMVGAVAAAFLAEREARRRGEKSDVVWDGLIWVILGGIIGARIWHILTPPQTMVDLGYTTGYYLTHPLDALAVWHGGLGIPGAVIGGLAAMYIYARRNKLNYVVWLDIVAPALALGQAIGRWGNFVNQELFGGPTNLPWKIFIEPQSRLPGYQDVEYYHPMFLYESLWSLAIVGILLWLPRRHEDRLLPGDLFLIYLILYPVGRFLLEFMRLETSLVGGININQTLMAVVAICAAGVLIWRHRKRGGEQTSSPAERIDTETEATETEEIQN